MARNLNPEQQRAVQTSQGHVLVLAGAGTGKTTVLAHRIAYLIEENDTPPSSILGLTFTNKAAGEMRERIARLVCPAIAKQITLATFHSFCMQVLRKEIHHLGFTPNFTLYDEKDVRRVLTQIIRYNLEHEGELPSLEKTMFQLSQERSLGISQENSSPLMKSLHSCMRSYNAVDFDSLLTLTLELFEKHPTVLNTLQHQYQYILIDEYQDTNPIQYKIANSLAGRRGNLCVVGDDDQSIYGWRGAHVEYILNFPAQTTIKLEQNYRSTSNILNAANHVIAHNRKRHSKNLWTPVSGGDPIFVFHAPNEREEATSVVEKLISLRNLYQLKWKDIAILYRSNHISEPFETALLQTPWQENGVWKTGIPYTVYGGSDFYKRSEIKDLVCYLRILINPMDQEALLRIINVPRRGIAETALELLTSFNRSHKIPLWSVLKQVENHTFPMLHKLSSKATQGIHKLLTCLSHAQAKINQGKLSEGLSDLLEEIQYKKMIQEDVKSEKMRDFKWNTVTQFISALNHYQTASSCLKTFLDKALLDEASYEQNPHQDEDDTVRLATIHSSKGLEFEACFLVGLEDHLMPHEKSVEEKGVEEERRLMYVAMTRAKKHLVLSMSKTRNRLGKQIQSIPSRFLFEIPKQLFQTVSYKHHTWYSGSNS